VRVVIAGATGLIGRLLAEDLIGVGHDVVALVRGPVAAERSLPTEVQPIAWAGRSVGNWAASLAGADAVVNLAGATIGRWPWTRGYRALLRSSRLEPTEALVERIASLPASERPGVLVSASGTDRYEGQDAEPATEDTPASDTFLARLCEDWEAAAARAEDLGVRVVRTRFSMVMAPGAPGPARLALPTRLGLGGRIGSGRQWFSWVDAADAIGILRWTIEDPAVTGPVNICAPAPVQQAEVARLLGRVLGRPTWLPSPAWAVRLILGEQGTLVLGSRRVWPGRALEGGHAFRETVLEGALRRALARPAASP
jgi:uncharacterized protein (TIGR01777 family)